MSDQRATEAELREFYSRFLAASGRKGDQPDDLEFERRLIASINAVPRQDFVGTGPWQVSVEGKT